MAEPAEGTVQPPHPQWVGVAASDCEKMLQHALTRDPTVKFMVDKMKEVQLLLMQGNAVMHSSQSKSCDVLVNKSFGCTTVAELLAIILYAAYTFAALPMRSPLCC